MDKDLLASKIFSASGLEVGLFQKKYLGEKGPMEGKVKLKHYMWR